MKGTIHRRLLFPLAVSVVAGAAGMFAMPSDAPVERLARNASAYVAEHPDDPYGYYVLGRIHALAFTLESNQIAVFGGDKDRAGRPLPQIADDDMQGLGFGRKPKAPTPTREELEAHLADAVRNYERALELCPQEEKAEVLDSWVRREPRAALFHLGLACVLEVGAVVAGSADVLPSGGAPEPDDKTKQEIRALVGKLGSDADSTRTRAAAMLRARLAEAAPILFEHRNDTNERARELARELLGEYWREEAIAHYFTSWERTSEDDLGIKRLPMKGVGEMMSYEAGTSYLKLVRGRGVTGEAEAERVEAVDRAVKALADKPPSGGITPIILSLDAPLALHELLSPGSQVCFDLDGDGRSERWPWVAPSTAILVWDPEDRGEITSGRQLLGSATWWLFPGDGYHALDLLDDNRDGELAGAELDGLALWFDRDTDGVSTPGEVIPVADAGVVALAAQALEMQDGCPANPWGVELADGRLLPTYDWITEPAAEGTPESLPADDRLARR